MGVFYRHPKPNSDSKFCDDLSATLKKLINNNKLCILTGDFNYDLFKTDVNPFCKNFINKLYSNMFQPCILEPTRIVDKNRPALIDNIFINFTNNDITNGNLISKIADHMPNFILISNSIDKPKNQK